MAKEKNVDLKQEAQTKMESMVEQHNALVQELQGANERLAELKQMIVEHQGYMKGLLSSIKIMVKSLSLTWDVSDNLYISSSVYSCINGSLIRGA